MNEDNAVTDLDMDVNPEDNDQFGFGLALEAFFNKKVQPAINRLRYPLPINRTVFGSVIADGSTPFIVPVTSAIPPSGRSWNVRTIGLYGPDAHTPISGQPTLRGTGVVTNPAANGTIASINAATLQGVAPQGTIFAVNWTVSLQGTVTAADANNMALESPANTIKELGIFPGVVGDYPQQGINITPGNFGIFVQAVGAASGVSAVYAAQLTATPLEQVGCIAEYFVGDIPDAFGATMPPAGVLLDNVGPERDPFTRIPGFIRFPRHAIWCEHGETIYAVVYDVPANTQLVIVANIEDWNSCDVEAMTT